jgi:uncharacterized membrane protein YkvA (DUF1232 family)
LSSKLSIRLALEFENGNAGLEEVLIGYSLWNHSTDAWEVLSMPEETPWLFDGAKREAERLAAKKEEISRLVQEALVKAEKRRGRIARVWEDLQALVRLLKAWRRGAYPVVPWRTIILGVAALIYFVDPFDLVPDFIPVVGYLDDATVIAFVIESIRRDLDKFLAWENPSTPPGAVLTSEPRN